MGYTTVFVNEFKLTPALTQAQTLEINEWMAQRFGSDTEENTVPGSFYCQWLVTSDGASLTWDKGEKFYGYLEWLQVLQHRFFNPWSIRIAGAVYFQGERPDDRGCIRAVPCGDISAFVVEPFRMHSHIKKQFLAAWEAV